MNLYQLYYFRTLSKLEHYTKAAAQLSMTQPSLSHAISSLESELGVLLFEKQGRNVVLTKYGKLFLPYVENAINELEAGIKKIKEMTGDNTGVISIAFIYTLSSHFIPNLIASFKKDEKNRNIKFLLQEGVTTTEECTAALIRGLKDEKFDLVFVSLIPEDPSIEFIPVCEQKLVALIPNDCPLASHVTIDLKDTEPYSLIHYTHKTGLKQEINRLFEKVNIVPKVYCEVEDEISMAGLVAVNMGIAIVPDSPTFHNFNIKILPISNPNYTRVIYLGYMKNRFLAPPVQRFKNFITNNARDLM
ncbi:LysR family transcriptional regulator [Pelotomaculum propionicicum]|mgnify:CR=1 FL=1|uniref:HTH-type transcriptional regulator GltC n=1 Tax=Pelotomaculum propionicicum TaxID=258475 RepID=A0A4Y7RJ82_9FIRM|nr:LysR family transcriptional regulator [Pelotomaculum propionicicum]NLI12359.1 LysR family transcriptional regulator [Peptococcaceae bacterium]TEB08866.1 HTH-type transcriptional regulator GltC [Pelotomaculum propionicicum]